MFRFDIAGRLLSRDGQGAPGGFSLFEMVVVFAIVGILLLMTSEFAIPFMKGARISATQSNMQHIIKVLAMYAQTAYRIPCPANPNVSVTAQPFGTEVGSGTAGTDIPSVAPPHGCRVGSSPFNEGIVPFKTLGLSAQDVRDGDGNYITYHVNPTFARATGTSALNAHKRCRINRYWVWVGHNRNGPKARFCCPDIAFLSPLSIPDITIKDADGKILTIAARSVVAGDYQGIGIPAPTASLFSATSDNVTTPAFVLVGHGDGGGAFTDSGGRMPSDGVTGAGETENLDGDSVFVSDLRRNIPGITHYDDVVMWKTQDELFAMFGHNSCNTPW